ncbi:F-box/LRR-repeat protein 14-like isoform X1 [Vanessa atalanta]|uniref:F-box/LRR-repeat protein 14-like isoform X1 n=1 Tax=Vanessa atalanta TaxID=42275 RepID=UPI001FCCC335|nr:F-box/LRR-repeat protein 14-like isoform X1 [Vanessa atalanta]
MAAIDLPYEVLVYLFKYLPTSDRKAASETCHAWYQAANDYCFLKNKTIVFYKTDLNGETTPLEIIENSITPYFNFLFSEVEISQKLNGFWDKIGENIKSLTIRKCDIHEKVIDNILHQCNALETLNIQSCKELFMSGCLLEKTNSWIANSFRNLKSLSLSENKYITDALFYRFVKNAPLLEDLCLSLCPLQFHGGFIKRFYPNTNDIFENPSECVFTFYFVLQFIESRAKHIKSMVFSNTLIDGSALKSLSEIKNLKLESLQLNTCDQLTNAGIISLTTHQQTLRELDIGLCTRVTDQSLMYISENLINLESLNIQRCRAVTNMGIAELYKLKKLKRLNISQCELITREGIEKGICKSENVTLQELDINSLNLVQTGVIMISETLTNLRFLDLSFCFNAVTDTSIQVIFKNQLFLHTLKISYCDKVSDAGLTGMGKIETEGDDEGPVMSNYNEVSMPNRIHLGSRAEEEIIRDARRKRDVMRMCEKLTLDSYTGYSLARMKSLQELNISGCNRITDVSLTYAFSFKELRRLNLSRCQQITVDGIKHLVKNCPSIEYLNLNDCYNLKDDAVVEIVKGLKRLQYLELRGCNQLTDKTLEAIKEHCKILKVLDVQGCHNISAELGCGIGSLPTLHTVLMSKPGPYITDGVKNRTPAPPLLPSLLRKLRLH